MRRAGARGHAPQRGRPPSPFPGRPEGLTCSPPAPGASSQVCAAGSPRVPLPGALPGGLTPLSRGNPPTPPPDPGRASAVAEAGAPHVLPTPAPRASRPRPAPAGAAAARVVPRPRVTPQTSAVRTGGRIRRPQGDSERPARGQRPEVSGLRPRLRPHTGPRREAQLAAAASAGRKRGLCDRASRRCPQTGPRCSHLVTCPALNQGWRVRPASERRDGDSEGGQCLRGGRCL